MYPAETAYKIYTGRDGKALNNGYVYFGVANQNPITSPITVYWDAAGTQPADQPLRTENGYIVRSGTPANVFVSGSYSELVQDAKKRQVFYAKTSDEFAISSAVNTLRTDLAASSGAGLVGWIRNAVGAVITTIAKWINSKPVSVYDFMSDAQRADVLTGSPTLDCSAAVQAAITAAGIGGTVEYQSGTKLKISASSNLLVGQTHKFNGAELVADSGVTIFNRSTSGYPGRIKFEDGMLTGTAKTGTAISITNNTPFVIIEKMQIGGFNKPVVLNGSYNSSINNSLIVGNNFGVHLLNECHNTTLFNTEHDANTYAGLCINGNPVDGTIGVTSMHNITSIGSGYQNSETGVWAEKVYDLCMYGTYQEGNTKSDLRLGVADAGVYARFCNNFIIDGWQSSSPCASGKNIIVQHAVGGKFRGLAFNSGTSTNATLVEVDGFSDKIDLDYQTVQTVTPTATVPFSLPASRVIVSNNGRKYIPYGLEALKFGTLDASPSSIYGGFTPSSRPALTLSSLGSTNDMQFIVNDVERHYNANSSVLAFQINHTNSSVQTGYQLIPSTDNNLTLGFTGFRWSVVYAGTGTINTSDERQKQQVGGIDPAVFRAWAKVNYCQYKFNDAVERKSDGARWHIGVIAQQVKAAFESEGVDPFTYGILCYDEWGDQYETTLIAKEYKDDDQGEDAPTQTRYVEGEPKLIKVAGNLYGIRYEEALALECAYLRSLVKP